MLINIINTIPDKYKNVYLVNKDCYKSDVNRVISLTNRNIIALNDDIHWDHIIDLATQNCHMYIGGDCGFSHFIANVKDSPTNLVYFHRTPLMDDSLLHR